MVTKDPSEATVKRNKHVLYMHDLANNAVDEWIEAGYTRADIFLMAGLIKDVAERLD